MAVDFARGRRRGPGGEVAESRERLERPGFVIVVVRDLGGDGIVPTGGSKRVVVPLMEPDLVNGFCDYAGGTLERIGGGMKGLAIGRLFVEWFGERVMETAGQTEVVLLRPGGSETGNADGE